MKNRTENIELAVILIFMALFGLTLIQTFELMSHTQELVFKVLN